MDAAGKVFTSQSGVVNEALYGAGGKALTIAQSGGHPSSVVKVEWSVTDKKGNKIVIQKLP